MEDLVQIVWFGYASLNWPRHRCLELQTREVIQRKRFNRELAWMDLPLPGSNTL